MIDIHVLGFILSKLEKSLFWIKTVGVSFIGLD